MKFLYEYRSPDNEKHPGVVRAANKEAAYAILKKQGIKPCRFSEAPGFFNKLFGKGKRWMVIGVLGAGCLVLGAVVYTQGAGDKARSTNPVLPRHQIEGLPSDWVSHIDAIFDDEVDRLLAFRSQPGQVVMPGADQVEGAVEGKWVETLRGVVAGMRKDADGFLKLGKSKLELALFLDERQRMEIAYRENIVRQVAAGEMSRSEAAILLSAMELQPL